jgi:hypothetical protein
MNMRRAPAWPLLALLVLAAVFVWLTRPQPLRPSDLPVHKPDPANGELVFHAGGCASCHGERLEGGLELETPYGTFRMPNISPEAATGIGGWSTLEFVNAVVRGVAPDGRHYYPAFPYPSYARMALRDAIDLKAYIDTLEPVVASNGRHDLAFPWNIRRGVGLWKRRYVSRSAAWTLRGGWAAAPARKARAGCPTSRRARPNWAPGQSETLSTTCSPALRRTSTRWAAAW